MSEPLQTLNESAALPRDSVYRTPHAAHRSSRPLLWGDLYRFGGQFALPAGVVRPSWAVRQPDRADPVAADAGAGVHGAPPGGVGGQLPAAANGHNPVVVGGDRPLCPHGRAAGICRMGGGLVRRVVHVLDPVAADRCNRPGPRPDGWVQFRVAARHRLGRLHRRQCRRGRDPDARVSGYRAGLDVRRGRRDGPRGPLSASCRPRSRTWPRRGILRPHGWAGGAAARSRVHDRRRVLRPDPVRARLLLQLLDPDLEAPGHSGGPDRNPLGDRRAR